MITTSDLIKELEPEVAGRSNRHRLNGTAPHDVAFVFHSRSRVPMEDGSGYGGPQALVCVRYPTHGEHVELIRKTLEPFSGKDWQFLGRVFCYWEPNGLVHFQARPTPEFGPDKWAAMLDVPVYLADESSVELAGITYREKIMCRFGHRSYEEFLACRYDPDLIRGLWDEPQMEDAA